MNRKKQAEMYIPIFSESLENCPYKKIAFVSKRPRPVGLWFGATAGVPFPYLFSVRWSIWWFYFKSSPPFGSRFPPNKKRKKIPTVAVTGCDANGTRHQLMYTLKQIWWKLSHRWRPWLIEAAATKTLAPWQLCPETWWLESMIPFRSLKWSHFQGTCDFFFGGVCRAKEPKRGWIVWWILPTPHRFLVSMVEFSRGLPSTGHMMVIYKLIAFSKDEIKKRH